MESQGNNLRSYPQETESGRRRDDGGLAAKEPREAEHFELTLPLADPSFPGIAPSTGRKYLKLSY